MHHSMDQLFRLEHTFTVIQQLENTCTPSVNQRIAWHLHHCIGYALHAVGGWTGALFIVGWDDLGKNVVSEVQVKRFKSKETGATKVLDSLICSCADCS